MATPNDPAASKLSQIPELDKVLTASALNLVARRKLLVVLANEGPKTGADLLHIGRSPNVGNRHKFLSSTLKNLKLMTEAGVIVQLENSSDGRRPLYGLTPRARVTREGEWTVIDFGFCVVRLDADGN